MDDAKLHIAMYPWLAMGHLTPFLHLSNELARRGHRVSFLLPRRAHVQLEHLNRFPGLITFHIITVPHVKGLPFGTEIASDIPLSLNHLLATAMDLTCDQVESTLHAIKPDFVFYDNVHWLPQVARQLSIRSVCYNVVSAASLAIALVPARHVPKDRAITEEELKQPPHGYPSSKVLFRNHEARSLLFLSAPFGKNITFYERITRAMKESDAIAIRTCQEIEGEMCNYIASQYQKPVVLSGPVLPEEANSPLEDRWAKLLDGFDAKSVVFCAFGTQCILEKNQFQEALLGFELTRLPFLVALKPPLGCSTIEEALPEGFEERTKGRGIVYGGWVQQPLILNHPSVGCFVNHCGFGSMWESLTSDCQIVLVPHLGDQILNTRQLTEELKVAAEVERGDSGWFSKESLCHTIKLVMDENSEVGSLLKKNHAAWRALLVSPTFMSDNVDRFTQNLQQLAR